MIVEKINKFLDSEGKTLSEYIRYDIEKLAGFAFQRQFIDERETKPGTLRLSSAGRCARKLAYGYFGYEPNGRVIDTRAKLTFFLGDLVELVITSLIKASGIKVMATGFNQITVGLDVDGVEIKGHPDGIVHHNSEFYLLEVKSLSSYDYDRFDKGEIDEGYIAQVNAYMESLGLDKCVFVVINKNNAVLAEQVVNKTSAIVEAVKANFKKVLMADKDNLPERVYKPDKKGFLPWQCQYCSYWKHCYPEAKEVLVGKRKKLKIEPKKGV